jgi:UDP:flavonoid glycosyltransferase YjiC (YdhE family)
MAQAMAAGIPQLLMPMAHDQPDNARRAERLGLALSIAREKFQPENVAQILKRLLEDPRYAQSAGDVAKKLSGVPALDNACDQVEELARRLGILKAVPAVSGARLTTE